MGQVAEGLDVLDVAVHVGDHGDRDQPRLAVHRPLDRPQIGLPVVVFDDPEIQALFLALFVVIERRGIGKIVGDNVVAAILQLQGIHQEHLAGHRAGCKSDLGGLGVDQLRELRLDAVKAPPLKFIRRVLFHAVKISLHGAQRLNIERIVPRRIEIRLPFGHVELLAQLRKISPGVGRLRRPWPRQRGC